MSTPNRVLVNTVDEKIIVTAPYDPAFPKPARALGGRFNNRTWTFDARDGDRVRELLHDIYGTDGWTHDEELATVRVVLDQFEDRMTRWAAEFRLAGLSLARRLNRDQDVRLADGVVVIAGGFPSSGGSMRNPTLSPEDGTVLEVRDLPRSAALKMCTDHPKAVTLLQPGRPNAAQDVRPAEPQPLRVLVVEGPEGDSSVILDLPGGHSVRVTFTRGVTDPDTLSLEGVDCELDSHGPGNRRFLILVD